MVKKFVSSMMIVSFPFLIFNIAESSQYSIDDFYSKFRVESIVKLENCGSMISNQTVQKTLYKKISISINEYKGLWVALTIPNYTIWSEQPDQEEGVVEPPYIQRLYEANGDYWDSITIMTVNSPKGDNPYQYFEIIDRNTLLLEEGCWVYTLKRMK